MTISTPGGIQGRVALEALRGDKTIQQAKHKVHPNQAPGSARRWTVLGESAPTALCRDHESEVRDLHAKIGEHGGTGFLARGLSDEPGGAQSDDHTHAS